MVEEVKRIKQVIELMMLSFFALIFCTAIVYLFRGTDNIMEMQEEFKNIGSEVYAEDFREVEDLSFKRSDIIAALMAEKLDYDIEVSGVLYQGAVHDRLSLRDYDIKDVYYKREYIYSRNGKVLKVIYTEA